MKNQIFHIAGGGIAGLASALAVANVGGTAMVMEKAPRFEAVGAGLQLGPNAVRALQSLGAWDAVARLIHKPRAILIRDGRNGRTLSHIDLGPKFERQFGLPYGVAHRADLLNALLGVAKSKPEIAVNTNTDVIGRASFDGFALIAADGMWSRTRDILFPAHSAIAMTDTIYRSLIDVPPSPTADCVTLWLYSGGHVVHYPVGVPPKLNLVAVTRGKDVRSHFQNACDELRELLSLPHDWTKWPAAYVPPLTTWNKRNITLIGDAAHGTLPYLAQGAAMALEDAATLQDILKNETSPTVAFEILSSMRADRTKRLHTATLRAGKIYHMGNFMAQMRNTTLQLLPNQLQMLRMAWIYDWHNK
jgi:salicylate hydroxylase